jgi:hypothetical protein
MPHTLKCAWQQHVKIEQNEDEQKILFTEFYRNSDQAQQRTLESETQLIT